MSEDLHFAWLQERLYMRNTVQTNTRRMTATQIKEWIDLWRS